LVIAPGHGWWRWSGLSPDAPILEEQATDTTASVDEAIDDFEPIIRKTTGAWQNSKVETSGSARLVVQAAEMRSSESWVRVSEQLFRVCQLLGSFFGQRTPPL
jgi:hypothetical protein